MKQARKLQAARPHGIVLSAEALSRSLTTELLAQRRARRLGAWAVHCRAFDVASGRSGHVFGAWLRQARHGKAMASASRCLLASRVRRGRKAALGKLPPGKRKPCLRPVLQCQK